VLVGHVESLLDEVLGFSAPADTVTSRYFRSHPELGHRDRGFIAEAVFCVLRRKLEFAQFSQSGQGPQNKRLAILGLAYTVGIEALTAAAGVRETDWLRGLLNIDRTTLAFEIRCNMPGWLIQALRTRLADDEIWKLAEALNRPAPLDLRVNALKMGRDEALAAIQAAGFGAAPTPCSPLGVRLEGKPALQHMALFNDGTVEVQDEGSQLLAHLLAPRRGEMVIDFCAGAGGKTLALGALMRNTGRLYAMDISAKRLAKLKPRLARSGLSNVHPVELDSEVDPKLKRMLGKADRVLVDAPCSGLGTLRRNPDLKWRQTPATVAEMNAKQRAILASAARLVKPGGRLVYATCSLLNEENVNIVNAFLAATPQFTRLNAGEVLAAQQIVVTTGVDLELWPHRHGTDGFYAAVLERQA
jgi:16S rRNA (cytosine967-C5)-methyltransferase